MQVPGQLLGHGNVDIAIQYSNNRDVLYLKLTRQPAIFAYPGMYIYFAQLLTMNTTPTQELHLLLHLLWNLVYRIS